jgi:hypothetical protein
MRNSDELDRNSCKLVAMGGSRCMKLLGRKAVDVGDDNSFARCARTPQYPLVKTLDTVN